MCVSVPVSQSLTVGTGVSPGRGLGGRDGPSRAGMAVWLLATEARRATAFIPSLFF